MHTHAHMNTQTHSDAPVHTGQEHLELPPPISHSSVTISQFALMMERLPIERYIRLRSEVEEYVKLGNHIRWAYF